MITLPDKIKNDLSGNLTSAEYLVAIKADPVIYISTTKQMFDATEGDVFGGSLESMDEGDWILGDDWEYDNGSLSVIWEGETSGNAELRDIDGLVDGETYKVSFTIENFNNFEGTDDYNNGKGRVLIYANSNHGGENNSPKITADGDYEYFVTLDESGGSANNNITIQTYGDPVEFKISNLSVRIAIPTYYEDIDLKLSNIKEKIDLKTKKIQLSSMSLTFSNFPINEVRLSDKLGNGLGKEISVYLKTESCETLEDCIKVADLKVNRYNHDRNTVKINADDKWLESFYIDLPREEYVLDKEQNTFENYHLKPVPILYGHLENAPALPYYEGGEGYSFISDGIKILPDSSYLGGSAEIQGIKQWNEYDSVGNLRSVEEMKNPNVLKIRLSDTTLATIPIRPFHNTRIDIRDELHTYSQFTTNQDYISIYIKPSTYTSSEDNAIPINSNLTGLWCSHEAKSIAFDMRGFVICSDFNNQWDGFRSNFERENSADNETGIFNNISTGYKLSLDLNPIVDAVFYAHNIGIQNIEFEMTSGLDLYLDEGTQEEIIADVQLLGDGIFEYTAANDNTNSTFGNLRMYTMFSPYKENENSLIPDSPYLFAGQAGYNDFNWPQFSAVTDHKVSTPQAWNFNSAATFTTNNNTLKSRLSSYFSIKGLSDSTLIKQYINYLSSGFDQFADNFPYNSYRSIYGGSREYPKTNASNASIYYTIDVNDVSFANTGSDNTFNDKTGFIDLKASWENTTLRKYWKNKDIFLKDFFVNAKGRVGQELTNVLDVSAQVRVFYESYGDPPTDFTSSENKHLTELYKLLTDYKYKTKLINGENYELMFYHKHNLTDKYFLYDIELNNFSASTDFQQGDTRYHYDESGVLQQTHGWILDITAKNYGGSQAENGSQWTNEEHSWFIGCKLIYGKINYQGNEISSINIATDENSEELVDFNNANGFQEMNLTGRTYIKWNAGNNDVAKKLLEQPEDIISNLVTTEMNAGGVQMPEQTYSKFGFSINEQENSKDIIEDICSQSELFFRYSPRDGQAIIDKIKKQYTAGDVDKTIESDRILKYSFNKTKIDDLCFGGCRVKWGWDYGKEEAIGVTEDVIVDLNEETGFMHKYLAEYGVEDYEKYQLEVEAPYINNEPTAIKFRDFLFQFYKNTHLTLKLTLAFQDGIELEVGDIVAFDKDIGVKPYGRSIVTPHNLPSNNGDQFAYPYFLITSVSKSLSKVDIEVMQMHNLFGTAINYGCTIEGYENYNPNANYDDGSCNYEIVYGCTDPTATNYDSQATTENEPSTCTYPAPQDPVASYNSYCYDESGGIASPYAGNQLVFISNSHDPDGEIVSHQWEMLVATGGQSVDIPYSLQNDLDAANEGSGLDTLTLNTTYDHIGLLIGVQLTVTDNDGNVSDVYGAGQAGLPILDPELDIMGDVTGDYEVNILDVVAVSNHIIGNTQLVGEALQKADIVLDGTIDILDLVALVNMIIGDTE